MKPELKLVNGHERRVLSSPTELRADASAFAIEGCAIAYNTPSMDLGGFIEVIEPGTFADSLRTDDQRCFFNHDANQILGRKSAGTLKLDDTASGLRFRCMLDRSNPVHQSVYSAIQRGDVSGCSFSFTVPPGGDTWQEEASLGKMKRTVRRGKLYECGPVCFPAYPTGTSVGARAEFRADYVSATTGDVRARLAAIDAAYNAQRDAHHRRMAELIGKEVEASNARG